jgi:flagellar motor switch protein FliN/FliY
LTINVDSRSGSGTASGARIAPDKVQRKVATLDKVSVDVSVVLGRSRMPIHQLLRMGRGAVIELQSGEEDEVEILANDMPVARGLVVVQGNRIAIEVRELIRRPSGLDS